MNYNSLMQKKSLIKTNPYLKNPTERESMLYTSVITSSAIEGIKLPGVKTKKPAQRRSKCLK